MVGVRRLKTAWQVYAKRDGLFLSQCYPLETTPDQLKRAREILIGRQLLNLPEPTAGSFAADAHRYLQLVTAMPTYDDRVYEIRQWVRRFGDRPRSAITVQDMRLALEAWRVHGKADGSGGLSPSSLNKRRTALMHLYTTLDGKAAANPVKEVPKYDESESERVRALAPRTAYRLIARVGRSSWKARRPAHRGTKRTPSKTRARLRLMLWTGWPPAQLMRLQPEDIDWTTASVWVRARRKGKGGQARRIPLLPGAVVALQGFVAAKAWGAFSTSGMHKAFQAAVAAENARRKAKRLPMLQASPYALRHTFGTEIAKRLKDERAIQELMLLTNPSQVRRYTEGATTDRLEAARQTLTAGQGAKSVTKLQRRRKRAKKRR